MTIVDTSTGESDISAEDARTLTDRIKVTVEGAWQLIKQAYETRAWAALGYSSWDDYCTREFGTSRLRLPREERQEVVASLRESGLSIRAIAAATGESKSAIGRALPPVPDGTPDADDEPDGKCEVEGHGWHNGACPGPARPDDVEPRFKQTPPKPAPKVKGTDGKSYSSKPATPEGFPEPE